jgi:uncharacterized protein YutE (UPF0331/DUF86 family)
MDPEIVAAKLESLARCFSRIEAKRPASRAALAADIDTQDIIVVNIERAVQLCVDIGAHILADFDGPSPATMADIFRRLSEERVLEDGLAQRLVKAVGFRNVAVHQYRELDWDIVFFIASEGFEDFRLFAKAIASFIADRTGRSL